MKKILPLILLFQCLFISSLFAIGSNLNVIENEVLADTPTTYNLRIYTNKNAINIELYDWTINEAGETVIFQKPKTFAEIWLKVPSFIQKQDKDAAFIDVTYNITLKNDQPAEYLAKMVVTEAADLTTSNNAVSIALGIGIPVYAWIKGTPTYNCTVNNVYYNPAKKELEVLIENLGNIHVRPKVDMAIYQKKGFWLWTKDELIREEELTNTMPILGQVKRKFVKKMDLSSGQYTVVFKISYKQADQSLFQKEQTQTFTIQ